MSRKRKLTPYDSELKLADNEIIAKHLRNKNWLCVDPANEVFSVDVCRDTLVEGESFRESPEYLAIHEKLRNNEAMIQLALDAFIKRALFKNDEKKFAAQYPYLKKYLNQYLNGIFVTACNANIGTDDCFIQSEKVPNLRCDYNGRVFLETIHFNLYEEDRTEVDENMQTKKTSIPGIISSRFDLTIKGFQLKFVEYSNLFLQNLSLRICKLFPTGILRKTREDERQELLGVVCCIGEKKLGKVAAKIENLISESPPYPKLDSIVSLTKKLLLERTNPTVLIAYQRLINSPMPHFEDDEANIQCIKLHEIMENLLREIKIENNKKQNKKQNSTNNYRVEKSFGHTHHGMQTQSMFFVPSPHKPSQTESPTRRPPRSRN